MPKFLITGGAGFIGSHLCESLLQNGHDVRILDNFSAGTTANLSFLKQYSRNRYSVVQGDVRIPKTCQQSCRGMRYVLHQAARKSVPLSIKDPHVFNDVNIKGTVNILQAAVAQNVKRVVFASSSSVYGDSPFFPQKETHTPHPISPYGITKLTGEHYCAVFSKLHGLETVCLRYFNVFGPRQPFNDAYSAVIVKFMRLFLKKQSPPVFGTGRQSRDFTYIDNVVLANYLAAMTKGLRHEVLNAATGHSHSILELICILNRLTGQKIKPVFLPLRPGDILKSYADITKARRVLNYSPVVSFDDGIRKTLDAMRTI